MRADHTENISLLEDNFYSIFSFVPLTKLIGLSNLNKTLQNTVKNLLRLSEQGTSIFGKHEPVLTLLHTLEQTPGMATTRKFIRPLIAWLSIRIQQQKSQLLSFHIITPPSSSEHGTPKPAKLIIDNQLQIRISQPPHRKSHPTQILNNPGRQSATNAICTLYTKQHNATLSLKKHLGKETSKRLNKTDLTNWEIQNAFKIRNIIPGVKCFVLVTEEGDAYGVGVNKNNMFCAQNKNENLTTPHKILLPENRKVKKIALSKDSMAILDDKGSLYTYGAINAHLNQQQDVIDDPETNATPLLASHSLKFIDVSIASEHLIALSDQHTLWGLGRNKYNQIGLQNSTGTHFNVIEHTNTNTLEAITVKQLADGDYPVRVNTNNLNSLFTTVKGHVYACGLNQHHMLGLPVNKARYPFTQIPTPPGTFFSQAYSYSSSSNKNNLSVLATRDREFFWAGKWHVTHSQFVEEKTHTLLPHNQSFSQSLLAKDWPTLTP